MLASMRWLGSALLHHSRSPVLPPRHLLQAVRSRALQQVAAPTSVLQKRADPAMSEVVTAEGMLSDGSSLLSPEEYSALEAMPLDESRLPKLEQQQRTQKERQARKKQARRAMLDDVQRAVERRHGRNARYIIAKMEKAHGENWTPKKKVSRADMERIRTLHRELPAKYSYDKLSFVFGISREAVARIVKSKWIPDSSREKKQAQQKNRVDVAGVLGAGGGSDMRRALPITHPAPPPTPVQVQVAPTSGAQNLVSLGAVKPDGYAGSARQSRATGQLEGAKGGARKQAQRRRRRRRRKKQQPMDT